jgi:pyrimidine-nucleoside phosphorylase
VDEFQRNLGRVGVSIMGQTDRLCPADRKMYALRDVTATVDSVPLIAASIMSKKLAEGIDGLVLDVKTGTGAFMPRVPQARKLARVMMSIGSRMGKKVVAVITGMWEPLGRAVGNALEVVESVEALEGKWPMDLEEVTLALGEEMLLLAGRAGSRAQARRLLLRAIADGSGLDRFRKMVEAQGGDPAVLDDYRLLPRARSRVEVRAAIPGHVRSIDALQVGLLGIELGVGRRRLGDRVDPGAGFLFHKKVGDRVEAGEVMAEVFGRSRKRVQPVAERLGQAIVVGRTAPRPGSRIVARLTRS